MERNYNFIYSKLVKKNEAHKVWTRLGQMFELEKIPIDLGKFRYCLKKENL